MMTYSPLAAADHVSPEESQAPMIIKTSAATNRIPGISRKIRSDRKTPINGATA